MRTNCCSNLSYVGFSPPQTVIFSIEAVLSGAIFRFPIQAHAKASINHCENLEI
jgi:hypothetical protein